MKILEVISAIMNLFLAADPVPNDNDVNSNVHNITLFQLFIRIA